MSVLAAMQQGKDIINRTSTAETRGLVNKLTQQELKRNEQSRSANEDLAYLSDARTGIYTIGDNEGDDNVQYTLRADWKDQVNKYHSGGDSKLRFNKLASNYLSKNPDGEVVKKRSKKTFGPTETRPGTIPTSLTDKLEANPNDESLLALKAQYEKGEKTAYIVPVENQEGMFSFITRFGTDEPDDEELTFSENEVEAYLGNNLISGLQLEIDPDARRQASAAAQGAYDNTGGYDQMNVSMERAKALYDDGVPRTTKLGILQQITDEYNKNPNVKEQPPIVTEKEVTTSTPGSKIDEKEYQLFKENIDKARDMGGLPALSDADMRNNFRKSKGLDPASTTTETVRTETAVDPIEVKFNEAFPGLENLSETELQEKVNDFINDGTFINNGFTPDQVQSVRTNLESMNVESMDDLKAKVEDGTVKNPYKYALTLNLALANDKGQVNGQDIKTATDRTFNYLVAGDPNRTAKEQIADDISIAQEQRLKENADFTMRKYYQSRTDAARNAFSTRASTIVEGINNKIDSGYQKSLKYLQTPTEEDGKNNVELRAAYELLEKDVKSGMNDYAKHFAGTGMVERAKDMWTAMGFSEGSFNNEVFYTMQGEAGQVLGYQKVKSVMDDVAFYNGYQQLVESNIFGALNLLDGGRITFKDWLGDFPAGDTPDNQTQFIKNLLAVRVDANGNPIELVIKRGNSSNVNADGETKWGGIEEGEASIKFDYLIDNNILSAEHLYRIINSSQKIRS